MYIKHAKHTIGLLFRSLESYTMLIDNRYRILNYGIRNLLYVLHVLYTLAYSLL